ncbi:sugar-transfer associated ATP-grasp domain-containing protein [Draconibacterium sediminis]|uniref:sugar-transfer associated ATP-grasp domain-containing protein n=1 Tax=Draconibacterium sediminis TaxID=1544798 RepID=UPI0009E5AD9A|nr:sugar-transfer associated ATP-grasp domain-containing protein [Draconibacterium sediminis]
MSKKSRYNQILGINRRNIDFIYEYNERKHYKMADDKLVSKELLEKQGFPTPRLIKAYRYFFELKNIAQDLYGQSGFVMKPAKGKGGSGILIIDEFTNGKWITSSGEKYSKERLSQHASSILSGVYSLDNMDDALLIEEKIQLDDLLKKISYKGIPDIRVIVFKKTPVMAMMRIPSKRSKGKANLHAGGIGVGIDIGSGITFIAPGLSSSFGTHPDTGVILTGLQLPYWSEIMEISQKIQEVVPLHYLGIDFVIDQRYGPQILELNVRPGLEIQNINGKGLYRELEKIGG